MVDGQGIAAAARMLLRAAPGSRVILFGSHARGEAGPDSDLDFVVVEPAVTARRSEQVRLRDVLRPLRIPVDILVVSEAAFRDWAETPGTVLYEAAHEGRAFSDPT
ncbi:MAG: nucleotidyltransferase domain-containing protein [Planctomycetes bacterium]|nr:nucleotidyltransferase domain-containing protein [Planctomycetota bacterium]